MIYQLPVIHYSELFVAFYLLSYSFCCVFIYGSNGLGLPETNKAFCSITILVLTLVLVSTDFIGVIQSCSLNNVVFSSHFLALSALVKTVASIASIATLTLYLMSTKQKYTEIDLIIVFSILGTLLIGSSNDFLLFYLALEIQSLAYYALATFLTASIFSAESGLKYFIFGAIASALLLLAVAITYLSFGTGSFQDLQNISANKTTFLAVFACVLFLIILLFKIGAAPFHVWLCDVYDASNLAITALFSAVPKATLFLFIIKFSYGVVIAYSNAVSLVLLLFGLFSVLTGSILAIFQKRLKRLFAYSSINHTGFILIALSCYFVDTIKNGITYVIIYTTSVLAVFSVLMISEQKQASSKYVLNWALFLRRNSALACVFYILLLSVSGVPPFAGFFAKASVIYSLLAQNAIITTLILVCFSCVASYYSLRLIKVFFFSGLTVSSYWLTNTNGVNIVLVPCLMATSFLFMRPMAILNLTAIAALI